MVTEQYPVQIDTRERSETDRLLNDQSSGPDFDVFEEIQIDLKEILNGFDPQFLQNLQSNQ